MIDSFAAGPSRSTSSRSGALPPSVLRASVAILCAIPLAGLAWQASQGQLGPRPVTEAIHQSGDWALRLLLAALAITPLRRILGWNRLLLARQTFGLAACAYALLHVTLYVVDQRYNWGKIITEIALRFYLTIGFVAVAGLVALAATSGAQGVRRLGATRWNNLHKIVYLIAAIGILHFYIQSKLDVTQPILMTGLFGLLMGHRLLVRQARSGPIGLLALAASAAGLTLAAEVCWYRLVNGIPILDMLSANFDFDYEIKPMWIVLAVGIAAAIAQTALGRNQRRRPER